LRFVGDLRLTQARAPLHFLDGHLHLDTTAGGSDEAVVFISMDAIKART
jgi:hypothetical protein